MVSVCQSCGIERTPTWGAARLVVMEVGVDDVGADEREQTQCRSTG